MILHFHEINKGENTKEDFEVMQKDKVFTDDTDPTGYYETIFGNCCYYQEGDDFAYDEDAAEDIPSEFVDFSKFIKD
jgi:hypothetical protein